MDLELISPEYPILDRAFGQSLSTTRRHLWHGTALPFLPADVDGYNLDLMDVVEDGLMRRLGVDLLIIRCDTPLGSGRHAVPALLLSFGRGINLGPLWVRSSEVIWAWRRLRRWPVVAVKLKSSWV